VICFHRNSVLNKAIDWPEIGIEMLHCTEEAGEQNPQASSTLMFDVIHSQALLRSAGRR
jgi:hypothetical protein